MRVSFGLKKSNKKKFEKKKKIVFFFDAVKMRRGNAVGRIFIAGSNRRFISHGPKANDSNVFGF